ncbi:MAG: hypothetical protein AB1540_15690 [Bdellovibrionota bacterium]
MFKCSRCHATNLASQIEKEHGDFIVRCLECGAENVIAPILNNKAPLPTLGIVGWRD